MSTRRTARTRHVALLLAIASTALSLVIVGAAADAATSTASPSPATAPVLSRAQLGDAILLKARVTLNGAYECKWSSNVPTHGLPAFRPCHRGETIRRSVVVPINRSTQARRVVYELSEYDMHSIFPKVVKVRRILQPGASTTPIATTTVLTNTPAGPSGQNVSLTATVTPMPGGGTVTFLAALSGASAVAIAQCTSVPVSSTTGTATCSFALSSSVGFQAVYSGFAAGPGATWAQSTSTLVTLAPGT